MFKNLSKEAQNCVVVIPESSYRWVEDLLDESYLKVTFK